MAVVDCKGCGAPLEVASGESVVVCQYCKAQNQVAAARSVHVHVHMQAPPPPPPPPRVVSWETPPASAPRARSTAGVWVSLAFGLLVAGVGVAVPLIQSGVGGDLVGMLGGN